MSSIFRPGATALISGGASGVGFAFAKICRRHGMNLAILDLNGENLKAASSALNSVQSSSGDSAKIETHEMDVSDLSAWQKVRDSVSNTFPSLDLIMLNAGASFKPTTTQVWEDTSYFHKTLDTNLFGPINGLATFLPLVQKSKGPSAVIFTGSKQGITNPPGNPAYNASKAALKSLAEQLAYSLRSDGDSHSPHISVHLLVPGWTYTGLSGNKGPVTDEEASAKKPKGAWLPSQCAEYGFEAIKAGKFYIICPDEDVDEALDQARMTWGMGDVIESRSALSRWDAKYKDEAAKWISDDAAERRK